MGRRLSVVLRFLLCFGPVLVLAPSTSGKGGCARDTCSRNDFSLVTHASACAARVCSAASCGYERDSSVLKSRAAELTMSWVRCRCPPIIFTIFFYSLLV